MAPQIHICFPHISHGILVISILVMAPQIHVCCRGLQHSVLEGAQAQIYSQQRFRGMLANTEGPPITNMPITNMLVNTEGPPITNMLITNMPANAEGLSQTPQISTQLRRPPSACSEALLKKTVSAMHEQDVYSRRHHSQSDMACCFFFRRGLWRIWLWPE